MKNKKMVFKRMILLIALIVTAIIPVYAQQYYSEKDFQIDWDPNSKNGVIINKYIGTKKEVNIPPSIQNNPVTGIGSAAFKENENITRVIIPDSVTHIDGEYWTDEGAFAYCTNLARVTIPDSINTIGNGAFRGCTRLTSIIIPNSVTTIGGYAFAYTGLTSVTIPDSVTKIGAISKDVFYDNDYSINGAFRNCANLVSVTIPNSVKEIGDGTFYKCTKLTSITIPYGVNEIGHAAFAYCTSLARVTIPDSITRIGILAFQNCTSLTSVTIPINITSFGQKSFSNYTNLTSVTFQSLCNLEVGTFPGDLVTKHNARDGGPGTYTRFADGQVWKGVTAGPYFQNGREAYNRGDYDKAIAEYTQAIRALSNFAILYFYRGNAYVDKGDDDNAIVDYSEAIRLNPNYIYVVSVYKVIACNIAPVITRRL